MAANPDLSRFPSILPEEPLDAGPIEPSEFDPADLVLQVELWDPAGIAALGAAAPRR